MILDKRTTRRKKQSLENKFEIELQLVNSFILREREAKLGKKVSEKLRAKALKEW